jgi:hypothetical protein
MSTLVYNKLRFGKESTPGTGVSAIIHPQSTKVAPPNPMVPGEVTDTSGGRVAVDVVNGKEHSEWAISGQLALADLAFWFSAAFGKVDIDSNVLIASLDQETAYPYALTMEYGNQSTVDKAANCRMVSLGLQLTPNSLGSFSGSLVGGKLTDGASPSSATKLPQLMAGPKGVSLWISTTAAGLTTSGNQLTKAKGLVDLSFNVGPLHDPLFTISEDDEVADFVEVKPSITAPITLLRSSSILTDAMTQMRAGTLMYARILAKGPTVSSVQSLMDIRFPFKWMSPAGSENQGKYARNLVMQALYDAPSGGLGTACQATFTAAWIGTEFGTGGAFEDITEFVDTTPAG